MTNDKAKTLIDAIYELPEYEGGNGADQVCRTDVIEIIRQHEASAPAALLNPDMPAQELRLHMGEMTAQEERTARAAIRWANSCRAAAQHQAELTQDAVSALKRLVDLKAHKDAHGKNNWYVKNQKDAWEQAQAALAAIRASGQESDAMPGETTHVNDKSVADIAETEGKRPADTQQPVGCASEEELIAHIAQRVSCLDNTVFRNTPANCKIFAIYAVEGMKNLRVPMRESSATTQAPDVPDDLIEDLAVAIAEELHLIPHGTTWEDKSERLAKAAAQVAARYYDGRRRAQP